jgi:hypothetical protein
MECPNCGNLLSSLEEEYCFECGCPVEDEDDISMFDIADELRDDALERKLGL